MLRKIITLVDVTKITEISRDIRFQLALERICS